MTLLYCFDNFFKDPDAVREYGLGLEYKTREESGIFPGSRTDPMHKVDPEFYDRATDNMLTMIHGNGLDWCVRMNFQQIWIYSDDKENNLNKGWVHKDDSHMALVVYLDPNPDPDSGTSFYSLKKGMEKAPRNTAELINSFFNYKSSPDDIVEYEKELLFNNSQFDKTSEIKNVYNRIIIYDASTYHAQSNCWSPDGMRFTMVAFFNCLTPREERSCTFQGIGHPASLY